ncbi:MAG: rhodanese-related sulfurtransferase [Verrucomicrobia bacterium]|nr:rhodanese-related sulfurtransferase [Verrucomicrobiota bacterium]
MQNENYRTIIVDASSDFLECSVASDTAPFLILAYYHFTKVDDPKARVEEHFSFFKGRDVKGRIYIANEGINGTLSAPAAEAIAYMKWMKNHPLYAGIVFKAQEDTIHAFAKLTVKVKKELVAYGHEVSLADGGTHVTSAQWRKMLEEETDKVVLDIRNDYEWQLGHFDQAEAPPCATFKEFREYAEELEKRIDIKNTKVMMYCTGGIRCEFFSAVLKERGIEQVFQLDGGIIKYGAEEKSAHWLGKLFVFDDRLSIPISEEKAPVIGKCYHCGVEAEKYYNCANMDCNTLFLCCASCLETHKGCCKDTCAGGSRVRPFKFASTPFRKWYNYASTKRELDTLCGGCSAAK